MMNISDTSRMPTWTYPSKVDPRKTNHSEAPCDLCPQSILQVGEDASPITGDWMGDSS
jgi:hypothetical protein